MRVLVLLMAASACRPALPARSSNAPAAPCCERVPVYDLYATPYRQPGR